MIEVEYYKNGCGVATESYICGLEDAIAEVSGSIGGYDYAIVECEGIYMVESDGTVEKIG